MDPHSGAIAQFETVKDAEAAGYTVRLTSAEAKTLGAMLRKERKAWLKKKSPKWIALHAAASVGETLKENRKARNARKRQRRARK